MKVLVTAGATCEYLDPVRFLTNASSGRMGCAVAAAAASAAHDVTLLHGRLAVPTPPGARATPFVTVADLQRELDARFDACDALVMAAAVGDFRPEKTLPTKIHRAAGPITLRLYPTDDLLAGLRPRKRAGQVVVAFAVEDGEPHQAEAKARREMSAKGADFVVVNTPEAMAAEASLACILSPEAVVLPWARRPKEQLAAEIVRLLDRP